MDLTPGPEKAAAERERVYELTKPVIDRWRQTSNRYAYIESFMHSAAFVAYRAGREDAAPCTAEDHPPLKIGDEEWRHVNRRGPGCWHNVESGRCLSWRGLLDHAWERGWASSEVKQPRTPLAEVSGDTSSGTEVER